MKACYDLSCNPPTYDVVAFLAMLELERVARHEEEIELYVLPGPNGGFRQDVLWPHSIAERVALRENLLLPLCTLLPRVTKIFSHKPEVDPGDMFGRRKRLISLPYIMKALQGGSRPLRVPGEPVTVNPKMITFTLREAEHHKLRNSKTEEWVAAAHELGALGWEVNVIRDTAQANAPALAGCWNVPWASTNLRTRAMLYAAARLNVGICNGPMWLSIFMNAPTLMLRPVTDEAHGCYDSRFYTRYGLPPGSQLPTSPVHQRLVWQDDTRENIAAAVAQMLNDNRMPF